MKYTSLNFVPRSEMKNKLFSCPEESRFYSYCIEILLLNKLSQGNVIEFGAGNGISVINAILRTRFRGIVQGYEINPKAYNTAKNYINEYGLNTHYKIFNGCFFKNTVRFEKNFLISNPPYLPSLSKNLILPELYGGPDGTEMMKKLLSMNFKSVMLLVPGISNPVSVLQYARDSGYGISDFLLTHLPFGYYSSQPEIQQNIRILKDKKMSFFSDAGYLIAGVLFQKKELNQQDIFREITDVMQSLR